MSLTILDFIVISVTAFSGLLALLRGFSREFLAFCSWIGAAFLAYFFHENFLFLFNKYFEKPFFALICAVAFVFIIALIILYMISMTISKMIIQSSFSPIDRVFGLIFGLVRGILICIFAVVLIMTMTRAENRPHWFENAQTLPMLQNLAQKILVFLPHDLSSYLDYAEKLKNEKSD